MSFFFFFTKSAFSPFSSPHWPLRRCQPKKYNEKHEEKGMKTWFIWKQYVKISQEFLCWEFWKGNATQRGQGKNEKEREGGKREREKVFKYVKAISWHSPIVWPRPEILHLRRSELAANRRHRSAQDRHLGQSEPKQYYSAPRHLHTNSRISSLPAPYPGGHSWLQCATLSCPWHQWPKNETRIKKMQFLQRNTNFEDCSVPAEKQPHHAHVTAQARQVQRGQAWTMKNS